MRFWPNSPAEMLATHPSALDELQRRLDRQRRRRLTPPPKLSVSEWADQFRYLSREASAEPGRWRTARAPYQKGILDAFSDPAVERVVVMSSAQVGKTEILLNVIGYFADQDPAPMLAIMPTISEAEQWSKTRLAPMIRDSPHLAERIREPRSRESGNTLLVKEFPGGHVTIVGANAPSGLAAKPIRVVLGDEIDRWPASAGTEGDPWSLAAKRTSTFWNRKLGMWSTPTLKGASRIESAFAEGDQRHYFVPCPDCGVMQRLEWARLRWDDGKPETAAYTCEACGTLTGEEFKLGMLQGGAWRASAPLVSTASFHLNALYSPWARWSDLAKEWLDAQGDVTRLQVFVNTVLGESWEDRGGSLDAGALEQRVEVLPAVPATVGLLVAGVDVQEDRLEVVVRGFAAEEESYLVARRVLVGETSNEKAGPWFALDALRAEAWPRADGAVLRIDTTCVDSGDQTATVYRYCRPRFGQRVFATKGYSTPGKPLVARRPTANNKERCRLWMIGSDTGKDLLYGRLKIATPGPKFYHFNGDADRDYFDQLTAETVEKVRIQGRWVRRYILPRGRRSEVLDCEVLCLVALHLASIPRDKIGARALALTAVPVSRETPPDPEVEPILPDVPIEPGAVMKRLRPLQRRRGWVNRW